MYFVRNPWQPLLRTAFEWRTLSRTPKSYLEWDMVSRNEGGFPTPFDLIIPLVLRYSPYNHAIVETVRSGKLGQLVNVVQVEPVGYYHFAHSYVRGNWNKEGESSFSLMTKSCQ